ncbi:hypothetical protein DJ64_33415 [Streptomyces griseorubens]|uniref:Secreted protein n=1 Tax=Streptomyces griseorubens TaxID=66897 RepID=A0ABR4T7Y1_9ACTN|nr:hypothetical protein DJ64_33415 [Streptomyces griseorubens]
MPGKSSARSRICRACLGVASSVMGIGWYGEPFQQGWGVSALHSRTFIMTSSGFMPRTPASLVRTALPSSSIFMRSVREAETTSRVSLSARGTPRASRMEPRTAGWTTCCTWLPEASLAYWSPSRIWRYHSRPPRVPSREMTRTWMTTSRTWTRVLRPVSGMLVTLLPPLSERVRADGDEW